ncbi:MAG: alanine racemase, partial [Methyloligellaceae bacterium]
AGIMLGPAYHFDLVRPGISLYGGRAVNVGPNPMKPVVRLEGRIAQIRTVGAGETVGYGAAWTFGGPARVATVPIGYADGFFRILGSSDTRQGAVAYIGDHKVPIVGRVSMDLITIDVSDVPEDLARRGALVELLGPHLTVDDVAAQAQTIGYEVLTSLGRRTERVYVG